MITLSMFLGMLKKEEIVPSDQQTAAINWVINGKGSMQLLARAGCGKTFTLMLIVRAIVAASLGDVVLMAYGRKIADELKEKLAALGIDWKQAEANTVHGFGLRAWKKVAPNVVVDKKETKVPDIIDALAVIEGEKCKNNAGVIKKLVSLGKQKAIGHIGLIDDTTRWMQIWDHFGLDADVTEDVNPATIIQWAIKVYKISLNKCREIVDYDDMILAPLYFKARFWPKKWVLVDEAQDTNDARRALALAMLDPRVGRMIFVGDDKQAIYGFTGADSNSMELLKKATNAITLPLNVTRRCPKKVVARAQALVPDFIAHEDAPEGNEYVLDSFNAMFNEGLGYKDVILCRNTAPLIKAAFTLLAKNVACRVEGRNIGQGLIVLARRWKVKLLSALLTKLEDHKARQSAKFMSKGQEDKIDALVDQIECLKVIIDTCLKEKIQDVDGLVRKIEGMFGDTPAGEQPKVLTLSTIHKSKGREWKRVYMLDNAKYLPSPYAKKDWQMEQEMHLEYVAITRSMDTLVDVASA